MAEAVWSGHVYGYAGYARMNRELIFRVANSVRLQLEYDFHQELPGVDPSMRKRIDSFRSTYVSSSAPLIKGYSPCREKATSFRVCYTMMETESVHPHFIKTLNENYDECWTPTSWNKGTFERSGCSIPVHVMPLGVNSQVFHPGPRGDLMPLELLTTSNAGLMQTPRGFLFLSLYQPTFRKGPDVLLNAFEKAFADDEDVALVLATTIHAYEGIKDFGAGSQRRARVYGLSGSFDEWELAKVYRACHAYVSTSRGEGWNLPMCEAAACGLPVILPRHSAHLDLTSDSNAFLYDPEGFETFPGSEKCSHWYLDQLFPVLGEKSIDELVAHLRRVKGDYVAALERGLELTKRIRTKYTWDAAASRVVERLAELSDYGWGEEPEQSPALNAANEVEHTATASRRRILRDLPDRNFKRPQLTPPTRQSAIPYRPARVQHIHRNALDLLQMSPPGYKQEFSALMPPDEFDRASKAGEMAYYFYLYSLVRVLQPRKILELGTDRGASALFMLNALPQNGTLITIDRRKEDQSVLAPCFSDRRLHMVHGDDLDLSSFGALDLQDIDLLYMDTIATHFQASSEWILYEHFLSEDSIVAVDDIQLNPDMKKYWKDIPYPKVDTGKEVHWSGLGLFEPHSHSTTSPQTCEPDTLSEQKH